MNTDPELLALPSRMETPSADFIHAISEFLDTNPDDLLMELGYYRRDPESMEAASSTPQN